jgi:UDP-N-acetylglucosamine 1-carboxyvinyltransferase
VGATENAVMAATLADGTTVLKNAAQEPEVRDLCEALRTMGAQIEGQGTSTITIHGVKELGAMNFRVPPDRIEAATYLIGAHLTTGDVFLQGARERDMKAVIEALRESGAQVDCSDEGIRCVGGAKIKPVSIITAPFPGFPTDVQAQWMTLMVHAEGPSQITETIFENRFMHVPELARMGASLAISGNRVDIAGRAHCLEGAPVMATDLRASASLVLAGLAAKGETTVNRIYHLDRGYESMESKLRALGASVDRVTD